MAKVKKVKFIESLSQLSTDELKDTLRNLVGTTNPKEAATRRMKMRAIKEQLQMRKRAEQSLLGVSVEGIINSGDTYGIRKVGVPSIKDYLNS